MCEALEVSKNAFYNWLKDRQSERKSFRKVLGYEIQKIYNLSDQSYGSPRITIELEKIGYKVSRPLVAKIMFEQGLRSCLRPKFVVTTDSGHKLPVAENILNREFQVNELGTVWVSDITYIRVNSDWVYLTTVIDLADRKVIGWCVSDDMTTENTVVKAWNKAINNRQIGESLLFHSDRGVQYASNKFRRILKFNKKVTQSMSRKGNCWDNAVAESFFKTIKHEKLNRYKFSSIEQVRQVVFEYIERWYNRMRIHSSLGYKTPLEKELELIANKLKNVA